MADLNGAGRRTSRAMAVPSQGPRRTCRPLLVGACGGQQQTFAHAYSTGVACVWVLSGGKSPEQGVFLRLSLPGFTMNKIPKGRSWIRHWCMSSGGRCVQDLGGAIQSGGLWAPWCSLGPLWRAQFIPLAFPGWKSYWNSVCSFSVPWKRIYQRI